MRTLRLAASTLLLLVLVLAGNRTAGAQELAITPAGVALAHDLDAMDVETKWPAGVHVDWETGVPDGKPIHGEGKHTHCSAFVASAAKHLGIYILRPPEHSAKLLANAQSEWLSSEDGEAQGWRPLPNAAEAQAAANRGELVVASYRSHNEDKPGHIAIVRPSTKSADLLAAEGPDVIQAGRINSTRIAVRDGFAGHPAAWNKSEIKYFAHRLQRP